MGAYGNDGTLGSEVFDCGDRATDASVVGDDLACIDILYVIIGAHE